MNEALSSKLGSAMRLLGVRPASNPPSAKSLGGAVPSKLPSIRETLGGSKSPSLSSEVSSKVPMGCVLASPMTVSEMSA